MVTVNYDIAGDLCRLIVMPLILNCTATMSGLFRSSYRYVTNLVALPNDALQSDTQ